MTEHVCTNKCRQATWHGPQAEGAMRAFRETKRLEAEQRQREADERNKKPTKHVWEAGERRSRDGELVPIMSCTNEGCEIIWWPNVHTPKSACPWKRSPQGVRRPPKKPRSRLSA